MTDLSLTIAPKSNQLTADDLIAGPRVIRITGVSSCAEPDQPIAISFDGDDGRPYKPCKLMRRVLVHVWGKDGNTYVGRSLGLYRDDKVLFGAAAVGGIRISHASDIDRDMTLALTITRTNRKPHTVKPLVIEDAPKKRTVRDLLNDLRAEFAAAPDRGAVDALLARDDVQRAMDGLRDGAKAELDTIVGAAIARTDEEVEAF